MAQITKLRCPKCDLHTETKDVVPAGKSIACPRCRVLMEITRPAGAVEDERAPNFTDDLEPILATRANRIKMAQKRDLVSNRPPPFHQSRSFIAAVSVTAIALGVFVLAILYRNVIGQLNRGMKDIRVNRENRVINNVGPKPAKPKTELAKSTNGATAGGVAGTADRAAGAKQNPGPKEYQGPVDAPAETKIGDLVVTVSDAFLVKVYPGSLAQCLLLKIKVKNLSQNPIAFVSWSQSENHVDLVDSEGKHLRRLDPLVPDPRVIEPDQSFDDRVAFEQAPLGFDLDLELGIAGRQRPIQIHIPGSLIKRSMDAAFVSAVGQQPAGGMSSPTMGGANTIPGDTVKKSSLHDEVNAAYQDRVDKLRVRTKGKSGNDAITLMRRGKTAILNVLAKEFELPVDQVKRMIDEP
jgi:hypothetical protein